MQGQSSGHLLTEVDNATYGIRPAAVIDAVAAQSL